MLALYTYFMGVVLSMPSSEIGNLYLIIGACGSIVGGGTMLQSGSSRVQFLMRSFDFSIDLIGPGVDTASNRNEYQESSWG
jgi:hypothetical protein